MGRIILYHGSSNPVLIPQFGKGEDRHDYGKGLYLTPNIDLAKEWSVCTGDNEVGYVFKIEIDEDQYKVLNFDSLTTLHWLAELMSHRPADSKSARYRRLAPIFIKKYKYPSVDEYDIIKGWRANASYFSIVKRFVRDEIDVELIPELFGLGDLGTQYCIKSERAFAGLDKEYFPVMEVDADTYYKKYMGKDVAAREMISRIIESEQNTMTNVFSKYVREES